MKTFETNGPNAVSETIDGEVVVVNLDSGAYYSIRGSGAAIWTALEQGHSLTAIVEELSRSQSAGSDFGQDVETFVTQLLEEKLLRPADRESPASSPAMSLEEYTQPQLEKFSDMESLLLLDPIHDVDEKGWPRVT